MSKRVKNNVVTPVEYAEAHGVTRQYVTKLLNEGRFKTARRVAEGAFNRWYLNINDKPSRATQGRPRKAKK